MKLKLCLTSIKLLLRLCEGLHGGLHRLEKTRQDIGLVGRPAGLILLPQPNGANSMACKKPATPRRSYDELAQETAQLGLIPAKHFHAWTIG